MPSGERCWTVSCARCNVLVGVVDGGRFIHNPDCSQPLAISRGAMRCCDCGGELSVIEQTVLGTIDEAEDDADELYEYEYEAAPNVRVLAFEPIELRTRD